MNGGESSQYLYLGNEPAFQTPWAYNWAGDPSRAQYIIPRAMNHLFDNSAKGLPGNDDMGALYNWYVWASIGLYPVIPSAPGLAMSTPQVDGITIQLGNGKELRIETNGKNPILDKNYYISKVALNGKEYQGSWLPLRRSKMEVFCNMS